MVQSCIDQIINQRYFVIFSCGYGRRKIVFKYLWLSVCKLCKFYFTFLWKCLLDNFYHLIPRGITIFGYGVATDLLHILWHLLYFLDDLFHLPPPCLSGTFISKVWCTVSITCFVWRTRLHPIPTCKYAIVFRSSSSVWISRLSYGFPL